MQKVGRIFFSKNSFLINSSFTCNNMVAFPYSCLSLFFSEAESEYQKNWYKTSRRNIAFLSRNEVVIAVKEIHYSQLFQLVRCNRDMTGRKRVQGPIFQYMPPVSVAYLLVRSFYFRETSPQTS